MPSSSSNSLLALCGRWYIRSFSLVLPVAIPVAAHTLSIAVAVYCIPSLVFAKYVPSSAYIVLCNLVLCVPSPPVA